MSSKLRVPSEVALENAADAYRRFPDTKDVRYREATLWPHLTPSFSIPSAAGTRLFTIGSCFARNIEEVLLPLGFDIPTQGFSVPANEWPLGSNGLLNEYNPGTMCQRVTTALAGQEFNTDTIIPSGSLFADVLLPAGGDVTWERALERRREINDIYAFLPQSRYAIVTLGFIECWFDNETGLFLNRMPPLRFVKGSPERYCFRRLDIDESSELLSTMLTALVSAGIKVIMTVSPVPLYSTFTGEDCVTANEHSKAVLRVCATKLSGELRNVDYFPSYEIVRSGGLAAYENDLIHVRAELVERITQKMVATYMTSDSSDEEALEGEHTLSAGLAR